MTRKLEATLEPSRQGIGDAAQNFVPDFIQPTTQRLAHGVVGVSDFLAFIWQNRKHRQTVAMVQNAVRPVQDFALGGYIFKRRGLHDKKGERTEK
jgi:hypothetical protein